MTKPLPLRVFLASPGDLAAERNVVTKCVDEFNTGLIGPGLAQYEVVSWDRVRGTIRRPQEAIDELIGECHYMIVLFGAVWGTPTGSPWGYTSGTEEELFTGLLQLGQSTRPMRDIWIAFVDKPSPAGAITSLRDQLTTQHYALYESIPDMRELKRRLSNRLQDWQPISGHKVPQRIDLLASSGADVLKAARLRLDGEELIDIGQGRLGFSMLKEASVIGGPDEQLAFARRLGRSGRHDEALAESQKAIDWITANELTLHSPIAADAFCFQADILRKKKEPVDAIGRLQKALALLDADDTDPLVRTVHCRILDSLGLACKESDNFEAARKYCEESLVIRTEYSSVEEICQAKINLARLEVACKNLDAAVSIADWVEHALSTLPPTSTRANAETFLAQTRLRQGQAEHGIGHARQATALNKQIADRRGEAMSLLVLAQCCRAVGMAEEALQHAQASLEVNRAIGDDYGANRARWMLEQLK